MRYLISKFRRSSTPWKYLLLGVFLFAQSFAASHEVVHLTQDVQDETCILCHSNDNNPTDTAPRQPVNHVPESNALLVAGDYNVIANKAPHVLNARAPPSA